MSMSEEKSNIADTTASVKKLYTTGGVKLDASEFGEKFLSGAGQFYLTNLVDIGDCEFSNKPSMVTLHYAAETATSGVISMMVEYNQHAERVPIWNVWDITVEKAVVKNNNSTAVFWQSIYNVNCKVELLLE